LVLTYYSIKMKNTLAVVFFIACNFYAFAQEKKVRNYKYIIVPERFAFLKQNDQYQTSSLTKFLLEKNGFTVVLDSEEYPIELRKNTCKALIAEIVDTSSMFKTSVFIAFKNCSKNVVYRTKEGESRQKDYKEAFHEAIRSAHAYMSDITYAARSNAVKINKTRDRVADIPLMGKKVAVTPIIKRKVSASKTIKETNTLYAQPNENGFQLINLKPAVVFLILKTNLKDVFIIKDKNGVLYRKETIWFAEFYEKGALVEKKYQIKF
jgi:hypothetical protein